MTFWMRFTDSIRMAIAFCCFVSAREWNCKPIVDIMDLNSIYAAKNLIHQSLQRFKKYLGVDE